MCRRLLEVYELELLPASGGRHPGIDPVGVVLPGAVDNPVGLRLRMFLVFSPGHLEAEMKELPDGLVYEHGIRHCDDNDIILVAAGLEDIPCLLYTSPSPRDRS